MCSWNELRTYVMNWCRIRGRWAAFLTLDVRLIIVLLFACVVSAFIMIMMSVGHPFHLNSFVTYGSIFCFVLSALLCYCLVRKWRVFFPEDNRPHPNDPRRVGVSWHDDRVHIPIVHMPAQLPEAVRLSDPDFRMPREVPRFNLPLLHPTDVTSEIHRKSRSTTPLIAHQKSKRNSPRRSRHSQESSTSSQSFSEHFNIRDFGMSDWAAQAFSDELRRSNIRSADVSVEVHVGPDKKSEIEHEPSSAINIGASTSRYSPDEYKLEPRRGMQPTCKKRLVNVDQSYDSSKISDKIRTPSTRDKSSDVADKNFPSKSSSGDPYKSSAMQSEGEPARRNSSSPEKSTSIKTRNPAVTTGELSEIHEQFISSDEAQKQKRASCPEQSSVELRGSLSSAISSTHSSGTLAEVSFCSTENKVALKPYGRSNITETPSESGDDFSGSSSSVPLHREKDTSSGDENVVSRQSKNKSPSRDVPRVGEKDESETPEESQ